MNAKSVAQQALGRYGEELAVRRLAEAGMTVIARNWRCRSGEIDIVARDKQEELHLMQHSSRRDDCRSPCSVACKVGDLPEWAGRLPAA